MNDLEKLLFSVRRSVRYHHRRTLFFDRFHKTSTFLSALSGTATLASVLAKAGPAWTLTFAAAVAVFSVSDLVVETARLARVHNDLLKKFFELEKEIVNSKNSDPEAVAKFKTRRLDIEINEPPALKVLDSICHNELMRALGYDKSDFLEIKWYQRLFAQFIDIREHKIHSKTAIQT